MININKLYINKGKMFISLVFLLGLFLPDTNIFFYFVPIITFVFAMSYYKFKNTLSVQFVLILLIFISLIIYGISNIEQIDFKGFLRNIVVIELFLFFPFVKSVRISNFYLYFAIIFIFVSQISYILGIDSIISFFNNFFPYEGDSNHYKSDFLVTMSSDMSLTNRSFRLGGLFHNPNKCAKYITIILAVFLIENYESSFKSKLPFLSICTLAIIATGSRTGFFIGVAMLIYYIYIKSTNKTQVLKYIYILIIPLSIVLFVYLVNSPDVTSKYRFLDYNEGLEKSFFSKVQILINYLSQNNSFFNIIFGNFTNDLMYETLFDSEWGEIIFRFGFSFLITLVVFYFKVHRTLSPKNRIFLFILLWSVSATVIINYRSSFVFMLLLSKYYSSDLIQRR